MEMIRLEGMNRELTPPKGWNEERDGPCGTLPVFADAADGSLKMTSAWKPSAEELEHLNAGGAVALVVYGGMHPPCALGVFAAEHVPPAAANEVLTVKVDASFLSRYVQRLVSAVQSALNTVKPPEGISELRKEHWKSGARAAITAVDQAIQSVPTDPNAYTVPPDTTFDCAAGNHNLVVERGGDTAHCVQCPYTEPHAPAADN